MHLHSPLVVDSTHHGGIGTHIAGEAVVLRATQMNRHVHLKALAPWAQPSPGPTIYVALVVTIVYIILTEP